MAISLNELFAATQVQEQLSIAIAGAKGEDPTGKFDSLCQGTIRDLNKNKEAELAEAVQKEYDRVRRRLQAHL